MKITKAGKDDGLENLSSLDWFSKNCENKNAEAIAEVIDEVKKTFSLEVEKIS